MVYSPVTRSRSPTKVSSLNHISQDDGVADIMEYRIRNLGVEFAVASSPLSREALEPATNTSIFCESDAAATRHRLAVWKYEMVTR